MNTSATHNAEDNVPEDWHQLADGTWGTEDVYNVDAGQDQADLDNLWETQEGPIESEWG